jgi:Holliday junction DNA helicase RuvA
MIAMLRGRILHLGETDCLIDVGGVGYQCQMTKRCLAQMGGVGAEVTIYVDTAIRDDSIVLTGFSDIDIKGAWNLLKTVQGVGTKAALSILSALTPDELMLAIAASDKAMISRADGVGPKLAQRIINELAEKVSDIPLGGHQSVEPSGDAGIGMAAGNPVLGDATSALVNLGYGRAEAHQVVAALIKESDTPRIEDILPLALKRLAEGVRH